MEYPTAAQGRHNRRHGTCGSVIGIASIGIILVQHIVRLEVPNGATWVVGAESLKGSESPWVQSRSARSFVARQSYLDNNPAFSSLEAAAAAGNVTAATAELKKLVGKVSPKRHGKRLFHLALDACALAGDCSTALGLYQDMGKQGIKANSTTFKILITIASKVNNAELADVWFTDYCAACWDSNHMLPEAEVYRLLMQACAQADDLPLAERWHSWARDKGLTLSADEFSAMLHASARATNIFAAERWLTRAIGAGSTPCQASLEAVCSAARSEVVGDAAEQRWQRLASGLLERE